MAVWSGIPLVCDEVDAGSDEFRLLDFALNRGELTLRDYDSRLPS